MIEWSRLTLEQVCKQAMSAFDSGWNTFYRRYVDMVSTIYNKFSKADGPAR